MPPYKYINTQDYSHHRKDCRPSSLLWQKSGECIWAMGEINVEITNNRKGSKWVNKGVSIII